MRAALRGAVLATGLLLTVASCSLTQSLDDYSGGPGAVVGDDDAGQDATASTGDTGPAHCGAATKSCGGQCVPTSDPSYGCSATSCSACTFANATAGACGADGACTLGPCLGGFADCDGRAENGCEAQLDRDPASCGQCGHVCSTANATPKCAGGECAIDHCADGYGDCNSDPTDGCEVQTSSSLAHCGSCAHACPTLASATFSCTAGECAIAGCAANAQSCDDDPTNGCECAVANADVSCTLPAASDAGAGLDASTGVASCYFVQCLGSYADCDGNRANGCEVDLGSTPGSCGACGFSCGPGATCTGGRCQPVQIIGSQGNPGQLAIDRDYAYWTNYGAGTIHGSVFSVRKDGVNPTPIAGGTDTTENGAWGIATSYASASVYWTTYLPNTSTQTHVGAALKVGSGSSTVQTTTGRLRGAMLDGNYLYYANYEGNAIVRIDVTQSPITPVTVAQAPTIQRPNTIVADGTSIYVTNEGTPSTGTTVGSNASSGTVVGITKASIGGTLAVTTFATGLDRPRGLAADDTRLYWTNAGSGTANGSLESTLKAGGASPIVLAQGLSASRELAICSANPSTPTECDDDPYVYVTQFGTGTVDRVRKDGTGPTTPFNVASGQKSPIGIAVDKQYVFWANYGASGVAEGTIMRLAKQP